jgi:hypothetical protein
MSWSSRRPISKNKLSIINNCRAADRHGRIDNWKPETASASHLIVPAQQLIIANGDSNKARCVPWTVVSGVLHDLCCWIDANLEEGKDILRSVERRKGFAKALTSRFCPVVLDSPVFQLEGFLRKRLEVAVLRLWRSVDNHLPRLPRRRSDMWPGRVGSK